MLLCCKADEQLTVHTDGLMTCAQTLSRVPEAAIHLEVGHGPVAEVDRVGRICLDCL